MPNSRVMLLISGSNNKVKGGSTAYDPAAGIAASLPQRHATLLRDGRARILRLIRSGGIKRYGQPISRLAPNRGLVTGPEFGGEAQGALYMPAAQRFRGRLYAQLGARGTELLIGAGYHILIVTGLYGLATPSEPIQDHQVDISDSVRIRDTWTGSDRLSEVLLAYMDRFRITHVFDMTAQNTYRLLIAWDRVRSQAALVLHCYGDQSAGNELLIPIGAFLCEWLSAPEERFLSLRPGMSINTPYERLVLQPLPRPPLNAPDESRHLKAQLSIADELGRMRRCIIRMLDTIGSSTSDPYEGTVAGRIAHFTERGHIPPKIARSMRIVTVARNDVEYGRVRHMETARVQEVRTRYSELQTWARTSGLGTPTECLGP